MDSLLARSVFLVKEHVGLLKAANNYDIHDPETGQIVLECREEKLGLLTRLMRFTDYKRLTPFEIVVRRPSGPVLLSVRRGISLWLSNVEVVDEHGVRLGGFRQKFFSIGGRFEVLDANDAPVCTLQGSWTGWEFRFENRGVELARVSKKWSGVGRELFTSADNYALSVSESLPGDSPERPLILAAVLCIDMVLKE